MLAETDSRYLSSVPSTYKTYASTKSALSSDGYATTASVTAATSGLVSAGRTVNGKALSADVVLDVADVGAATTAQGELAEAALSREEAKAGTTKWTFTPTTFNGKKCTDAVYSPSNPAGWYLYLDGSASIYSDSTAGADALSVSFAGGSVKGTRFFVPTKGEVDAKYTKPAGGIPKSDLDSSVSASLDKADVAVSRDELSAGFTEWTWTSSGITITEITWGAVGGGIQGWLGLIEGGGQIAFDNSPDRNATTLSNNSAGVTATRVRIPKWSELSAKAEKSELAISAASDVTKKTIQLKSGTSADVVVEHQQLSAVYDDGDRLSGYVLGSQAPCLQPAGDYAAAKAMGPAFSPLSSYQTNEYVTYGGNLYRFTSFHASGAWTGLDAEAVSMTAPDATLDVMANGRLRVVAADGSVLWQEGYNLAAANATSLSTDTVNVYAFAVNATDIVHLALPSPVTGKVSDLILDVSNPSLSSAAADAPAAFSDSSTYQPGVAVFYDGQIWRCTTAVETAGAWTGTSNWEVANPGFELDGLNTSFCVVVGAGKDLAEMLTIEPGTMCRLSFTLTAFRVDSKPTWSVSRLDVEQGGVSV